MTFAARASATTEYTACTSSPRNYHCCPNQSLASSDPTSRLVYDDVLQYRLYSHGAEVDVGVVATPVAVELAELAGGTLPEADAGRLVARLGRGDEALARRALSPDEPIGLAAERHAWLVEALDLPRCAPGWGYRYLISFPDGFDGGPLTPVGGAAPEEAT